MGVPQGLSMVRKACSSDTYRGVYVNEACGCSVLERTQGRLSTNSEKWFFRYRPATEKVVRILLLVGFEFAVCPNLRFLVLGRGSVRGKEGFDHLIGGGRGASESQNHFHRVSNTH